MIKALLFDLDDTLLGNDMQVFIPAYFQAVARHFPELDADQLVRHLVAGTRAMRANVDPTLTLRQVFLENFPPAQAGRAEALWERFETFYRSDFAGLRALIQVRPEARPTLEWAQAAGYSLVIATAPLFPLTAIRERLRWAGVDRVRFELITHIENSRFAKPHPEYFAAILARLGLRPEQALMIGNDWADDLEPAAALGLPHYWIAEPGQPSPSDRAQPLGRGRLEDFLAWAQLHLGTLEPPAPPPTAIPALLAGHLAQVLDACANLPEDLWTRRPAAGEWSLTEVICHLRDVDQEVNLARVQLVLEDDNPFITGADTDPWAMERNYQAQSGPQALAAFAATRQPLYRRLAGLPAAAWGRPARHAFFGPTTLAEIMGWGLDHDRIHLEQIRATLGKIRAQ
jgi:FMN phosphatase YigB (HAD superfamily)